MASQGTGEEEKLQGILPVLACVLTELCVSNDEQGDPKRIVSKFHALCVPSLDIKGYLERIAKYSGCSPECFVLCLVYIDRIIQCRRFIVNSYSIHRLLITGSMLATKFFDDHYYNNAYYAKVGGVTCEEMNSLEVEFLFMLNFHLFVSTRTYKLYYQELVKHPSVKPCNCSSISVPPLLLHFDKEVELSHNSKNSLNGAGEESKDSDTNSDMKEEGVSKPDDSQKRGLRMETDFEMSSLKSPAFESSLKSPTKKVRTGVLRGGWQSPVPSIRTDMDTIVSDIGV